MEAIKPEEWEEWRLNPVTRALFHHFLPRARLSLMEQWAAGQFQDETEERTLVRNTAALGQIECYERLREIQLQDFNEVITDKEELNDEE